MFKYIFFLSWLFLKTTFILAGVNKDTSAFIESQLVLKTNSGNIFGTLTVPAGANSIPVALIISGSGPTDRDGNNPFMKNDCLKQLAQKLSENNIASFRYDKRGIGESKEAGKNEADLRFDDYVNDAKQWIELLRNKKQFSKIIIIGHSEGSLIGMIAGEIADKFISIAGAGQPADKILKEQLSKQPKMVQDSSFPIIDSLKTGKLVNNVNPMLNALFRPSVQPYLISWFKYDPQEEIKKLKIPILILQGTNDIQVTLQDAERLKAANPNSKLVILENMNHVLKKVSGDRQENLATYNNSELPVDQELVENITSFILAK
jgi:hypothetical protein